MSAIYIIKSDLVPECYVGSCKNFIARRGVHRSICNKGSDNRKLYNFIRANGGWSVWKMDILCSCEGLSKIERHILESEYTTEYDATLNSYKSGACFKDTPTARYYMKNRETILQNKKLYYENKKTSNV